MCVLLEGGGVPGCRWARLVSVSWSVSNFPPPGKWKGVSPKADGHGSDDSNPNSMGTGSAGVGWQPAR